MCEYAVGSAHVSQRLADSYSAVADIHGRPVDVGYSDVDNYLLHVANQSLTDYRRRYFVAATANGTKLTGHFNNFALHSIAVSLSLADNAVLRYAVHGSGNCLIRTINHPLPRTGNTLSNSVATTLTTVVILLFETLVCLGMTFLACTFVLFVVVQHANNAKHCQFVSGVDAAVYWLAALAWDLVTLAVPSALVVVVVVAFQIDAYVEWPVCGCLYLALVLYGWSVIPFVYVLSFAYKVASTAYSHIVTIVFYSGMLLPMVLLLLLQAFNKDIVVEVIEYLFYFTLPYFCCSQAVKDVGRMHQISSICSQPDDVLALCELLGGNSQTTDVGR